MMCKVDSCLKTTVETLSSETRSGGIAHNEKIVQFSVGSDSWSSSCCVCSVRLCQVMCESKCERNTSFASCPQMYDKPGQSSICIDRHWSEQSVLLTIPLLISQNRCCLCSEATTQHSGLHGTPDAALILLRLEHMPARSCCVQPAPSFCMSLQPLRRC